MSRPIPKSERERLDTQAGRLPCKAPPPLRPGQARRQVRKLFGESIEDAITRAAAFPWWPQVVDEMPGSSGPYWLWTITEEAR